MRNVTVKVRQCYLSVNIEGGQILSVCTDGTECIDNLICDNEYLQSEIKEKAEKELLK